MATRSRRTFVMVGAGAGMAGIVWALAPMAPWGMFGAGSGGQARAGTMTVWYSPSCGCCGEWIAYLERSGMSVEAVMVGNPTEVAVDAGIPLDMQSCHTAMIDGLLIEGHVPVDAIQAALSDGLHGVAVPGMPGGSPGMESAPAEDYTVYSFGPDGSHQAFMHFRGQTPI